MKQEVSLIVTMKVDQEAYKGSQSVARLLCAEVKKLLSRREFYAGCKVRVEVDE